MTIRLRKYSVAGIDVRAIKITEKNIEELSEYLVKRGVPVTYRPARPEIRRPARIRIKQRNYGHSWGKVDWRVALIGDYIVREDFLEDHSGRVRGTIEYSRLKNVDFVNDAIPA